MLKHEVWLAKALSDLKLAQIGAQNFDVMDSAIFHTQQCAEKALKAYLVYREQPIHRTHDLEMLIKSCSVFDKSFMALFEQAALLNPYCFGFRYPIDNEEVLVPESEEMSEALAAAEYILDFVKKKLS
ncbi:HEPN domain-containing protein [bacterium]|nr:MAG: HEPN domain-containing protein [bacterium]